MGVREPTELLRDDAAIGRPTICSTRPTSRCAPPRNSLRLDADLGAYQERVNQAADLVGEARRGPGHGSTASTELWRGDREHGARPTEAEGRVRQARRRGSVRVELFGEAGEVLAEGDPERLVPWRGEPRAADR